MVEVEGSSDVLASDVDGSNLGLFLNKLSRVVCCADFLLSNNNFLKSSKLQSNSFVCSTAGHLLSLHSVPSS
jgi:hypothetical protein